jgi:2-aminophenol/2-amino-5-chlorophenol 1,6-dioxygenase subunit alpha
MTVVSAFSCRAPLPLLKPEALVPGAGWPSALQRAGRALAAARPDAVLLYSTQWLAVLDELWLTRRRSQGVHVDENWYEYGDLSYDITVDTELAHACVAASPARRRACRGVNYDGFPIDTGTIVACACCRSAAPSGRW